MHLFLFYLVPAKIEKLRIKIPKKEDTESPAMDLSTRLSGCSQVSDEEEEEDDDESDDEESSNVANSGAHASDRPSKRELQDSPTKEQNQDNDNQSSDGEDGSNKDDSSSDSDDSSSDDQSD